MVLLIQEKLELIIDIEKEMSKKQISFQYGIGENTVRNIFKQKDKLMKFASASDNLLINEKQKTMKTCIYEELNATVVKSSKK